MQKKKILLGFTFLCLASLAFAQRAQVVAPQTEEFVADISDFSTTTPELYTSGEACGGIGEDFCQSRCEDKQTGSWILVGSECETTDDMMQFHCTCHWLAPLPVSRPPCYWNCNGGGGRTYVGNGLY